SRPAGSDQISADAPLRYRPGARCRCRASVPASDIRLGRRTDQGAGIRILGGDRPCEAFSSADHESVAAAGSREREPEAQVSPAWLVAGTLDPPPVRVFWTLPRDCEGVLDSECR